MLYQVLASLSQARRRLVLQSGFHAVYLVTPPAPSVEPCWNDYERLLDNLLTEYPVPNTALKPHCLIMG
jgi:hypothetical protein